MQILGVQLHKPTLNDMTKVAVMTTFLLVTALAACTMIGIHPSRPAKALFFAAVLWGMVGDLIGIRVRAGWRHIVLNVVGSTIILGAAFTAVALFQ